MPLTWKKSPGANFGSVIGDSWFYRLLLNNMYLLETFRNRLWRFLNYSLVYFFLLKKKSLNLPKTALAGFQRFPDNPSSTEYTIHQLLHVFFVYPFTCYKLLLRLYIEFCFLGLGILSEDLCYLHLAMGKKISTQDSI